MRFRRILTLLDKPNRPQMALKRAARLATDHTAELHAVSFLWNEMVESSAAFDAKQRREMKHQMLELHHHWLSELAEKHPALHNSQVVWGRDIENWLTANQQKDDLLIKTAAGKGKQRSPLDWQLIANSQSPLWLVAHKRIRRPKVVMATIDLGHKDATHRQLNARVLDAASTVAAQAGAKLHIVHAIEVPTVLNDLDVVDARKAERQLRETSAKTLSKMLVGNTVPKKRIHFPVGPIGDVIAAVAKDIDADVVVAGTCAHPLKQAIGIGNSAQRIIRKAPVDVLTVPVR